MTVAELIDALKNCNPDAEIFMYTGDLNLMIINDIEQDSPVRVVIS